MGQLTGTRSTVPGGISRYTVPHLRHKHYIGGLAMRRRKLSRKASRKNFRKGAKRVHKKNRGMKAFRGGYRA